MSDALLCSACFQDEGLRLDAEKIGIVESSGCPNCGSVAGRKLDEQLVEILAHRFFVWGTIHRVTFGAAPVVVFNRQRSSEITPSSLLQNDVRLLEKAIGVGFFRYGPRLWMVGEVEPLLQLQDPTTRASVIARILSEFPTKPWPAGHTLYRLRKGPKNPDDPREYESPPAGRAGTGRLDAPNLPMLYGSPDLQLCIHECRVTAEDELYVATLSSTRELRVVDLTEVLKEDVTEFESLDMAVHMLFLAGPHSYDITRDLARAAHAAGYDGLVYPSTFSLLRTGAIPFETSFGISLRRVPRLRAYEASKTVPNLALFGRPVEDGKLRVRCINKLLLSRVEYDVRFGPVAY